MRSQKLIILLFLLNTFNAFSQTSIPSELMNKPRTDDFYKLKENNAESIVASETNYLRNETYINKWIFNYSADTIIRGKLLKNEELKSVFEYVLDYDKRIIDMRVNFFSPNVKNDKQHIRYKFTDRAKILIFLDDQSEIKSKIIVDMDSLQSPIRITSVNSNNEIQSKETADYNYRTNTYNYKVYNYYNEIVLNKTEYYNKNFVIEKNNFDDITKMFWPLSSNKVIITFEYKYDKKGNWIKRIKKNFSNNSVNIATVVKRNIKYKD
ncbi:hypothetical protein [Flavobacterium sp. JAS]|uniref:hypothetical protein n=1 Tax=Flavobacterium sp. JAS TaxID=2897329 RepID=UPI001E2E0D0B|nr:hypothetical protein [Flavobacterium sp. JAS]MCD0469864.1 hypothetical protein [Flavobacterium sp. JAS]